MKIGSLWLKEKNGMKYFSGTISLPLLGRMDFAVFKAVYENGKPNNAPDYNIVWSEKRKKSEDQQQSQESWPGEDDVPF